MGVIIDRNADDECFKILQRLGVNYCKSYNLEFLYNPVNTHPDMQIHFFDSTTAIVAPSAFDYYRENLPPHIDIIMGNKDPGGTYPQDCAYNVAKVGKKVIGNLKYTDKIILDLYTNAGYELINTRQGYTKCNLCIVDENSVITEDEGLFSTMTQHGIDTLLIPKGDIILQGFDYGFIGGASGKISDSHICFFGILHKYPYYENIMKFLTERKVSPIYLSQTMLKDFGSLLSYHEGNPKEGGSSVF